jgi:DNA-binding NarL/FixJ family response regulator
MPAAACSSAAPIRVALILSSKLERLGWGIVVDSQADMQVVGQFPSFASALAFLKTEAVDVALVDEAVLTPKACDAIRRRADANWPRFLVIAQHPVDPGLASSDYSFASRYLLKGLSAADLLAAIRKPGLAN